MENLGGKFRVIFKELEDPSNQELVELSGEVKDLCEDLDESTQELEKLAALMRENEQYVLTTGI